MNTAEMASKPKLHSGHDFCTKSFVYYENTQFPIIVNSNFLNLMSFFFFGLKRFHQYKRLFLNILNS